MKINIKVVSFLTHFRCSSRQRPGGDVACFCSLRNFRCLECGSLLHVAGGILSFVFLLLAIHTPPHSIFLHVSLLACFPPVCPPLRPCWPKMIKCHQSPTPWRRAWPGVLPRSARPGRGGPPLWGGGLVALNHFWSARSREGEGWAWIPVHRGQRSCRVI